MSTVITWMVFIPLLIMAGKFWIGLAKWGLNNKRDIGQRVQRVRSAYADSMRENASRHDEE